MINLISFGGLGPTEIILIVFALLLLFGGRKIPELMKGLGKGMKEFKKAQQDMNDEPEDEGKKSIKED
jgi:sec-independent protein translocase protein TatA